MSGFLDPEPITVAWPEYHPPVCHHQGAVILNGAGERWCATCRAPLAPNCDCDRDSEHQPGCPLNPDEQADR